MRKLLTLTATALALLFPSTSAAHTITPMWSPLNVTATKVPSAAQADQFKFTSGWPWQQAGKHNFWTYVKGSRTLKANLNPAWYLTQNGVRVKDKRFGSYVMNPSNPGWQQHIAKQCPHLCFLDGMGVTSLSRTSPHLTWTHQRWIDAVVSELKYIQSTGDIVVPNSVGVESAPAYLAVTTKGSTEAWQGFSNLSLIASGSLWVVERNNCGWKAALFLMERAKGDYFSCYNDGDPAYKIPKVLIGKGVGQPLGAARSVAGGLRRNFVHAKVWAYTDGTYKIVRQ